MIIRDKSKSPLWTQVQQSIRRLSRSDITWDCGKLIALPRNFTAAICLAGNNGFELNVWVDFRGNNRFRLFAVRLSDIKQALLNRDYLK